MAVQKSKKSLSKFLKTREYFLPKNNPIKSGDILLNKNYAETLRAFSKFL